MAWRCSAESNRGLIHNLVAANIITLPIVRDAMLAVDRVHFAGSPTEAYQDSPLSIGYSQTISAPHMHAYAAEHLASHISRPGAAVLDVGVGSGYLSAVFAEMVPEGGHVYGIDCISDLVKYSEQNLLKQNPNYFSDDRIQLSCRDGWEGWPEHAPYDAIHVGAGAASMPQALLVQLKVGGRMIIPVDSATDAHQDLLQVDRISDTGPISDQFKITTLMGVRYVPLVKGRVK